MFAGFYTLEHEESTEDSELEEESVTDQIPGEAVDWSDAPIHTLLVDDDGRWAEFMATEIERAASEIRVSVALGANEAIITLQERDDVDCLVTDYRMPRVDGIELLKRVREEYPNLPVLLVTSEGSEDVAARGIEAGLTDYLVKNPDPNTDQTSEFVTKIRAAVKEYRLREAIAESEQRYCTVTEQSRDAIAIFQHSQLVFHNHRLIELLDREESTLTVQTIIEKAVHPADRASVRTVVDSWMDGTEEQPLHETRIQQPDGTVRYCEFTGGVITYGGEDALLVSIRDVTTRRQRERELKWERDLNRTVQEALVESRTRHTLEKTVTDQLQDYGYPLVWIAQRDEDALHPRVVQGATLFVDEIDWTVDTAKNNSEPTIRAVQSGEPQFVSDFDELFPTPWRETANDYGYRGGAAIPLIYNDITYGLLSVYTDRTNQFDETERRLLTELADTVAFAIHSLETETALAATQVVEVTLQVDDTAYYLVDLATKGAFMDCNNVIVRGTVPHTDGVRQYLTVYDCPGESIQQTILAHEAVQDIVVISEEEPVRFQVTASEPVPETALTAQGIVVQETSVKPGGATISTELPAKDDVRSTVDRLGETFDSVSVLSVVERAEPADDTDDDLTQKQATALEAAYHHGYFEQPRKRSASEIADSLGVSHPTFLQHLRAAQLKLFKQRFTPQ